MRPTVKIEMVTPRRAKEWLQGNVDNRKLRETRVVFLAGLLTQNEWELTGDAIVFDDKGILINGQHRLSAVVVAGKSAQFLVLRGVPSQAQEVMDQGLSRNLGDQLHRRHVTYSNVVAGALAWLYQMDYIESTGNVHYVNPSQRPSLRTLLRLFEQNPHLPEEASELTKLVYYTKVRHGPTLALYHRFLEIDEEEAMAFIEQWQEGTGLAKNDPIWRLREWTINDARLRSARGRAPTYRYMAVALKAWNAWREGRTLQVLKWNYTSIHKDPWPTPI
jgi:hypothetical protein